MNIETFRQLVEEQIITLSTTPCHSEADILRRSGAINALQDILAKIDRRGGGDIER